MGREGMRILYVLELVIGIMLLATITILVFVASVMRFFGYPLIWSVDLAQLLFIWLCFFGASRAIRERVHLGVDLLVRLFSDRMRLWIDTALSIVILGFLGILVIKGFELTMLNWERLFGDSGLSYGFVTIAVSIGSALLAISLLANLLDTWKRHERNVLVFTKSLGEQH